MALAAVLVNVLASPTTNKFNFLAKWNISNALEVKMEKTWGLGHNAQSVSRVQKLKRHSEIETSLAHTPDVTRMVCNRPVRSHHLIWVRVIYIVLSVLM